MPAKKPAYKVLVVDDQRVARAAVAIAFSQQGFECFHAEDGEEAFQRVAGEAFDLVVTDLKMPRANGHQFASRLLDLPNRPLVVVHSAVTHPQLVTDLMRRGVDDFVFKPTVYPAFAAKMKALVGRARSQRLKDRESETGPAEKPRRMEPPATFRSPLSPIGRGEFRRRIEAVRNLLPMSASALEVYRAATSPELDMNALVARVSTDPGLTAELLRLANSSHYRRNRRATVELDEAIVRVGVRKAGEIALSLSGLAAFRDVLVPWLNSDLLLRRSRASRAAMAALVSGGCRTDDADAIDLCLQFYPLSRLLLGIAFPDEYRQLISACAEQKISLSRAEKQAFPEPPSWALAHLLREWGIPENVCQTLSFTSHDYGILSGLPERQRAMAERIKVAAFLGDLAVGQWFDWDEITPPPRDLLIGLGIADLVTPVMQGREKLRAGEPQAVSRGVSATTRPRSGDRRAVHYVSPLEPREDWLAILLRANRLDLRQVAPPEAKRLDPRLPAVVNAVGITETAELDAALSGQETDVVLFTEPSHKMWLSSATRLVPLPSAHSWLAACCRFEPAR